MSIFLSFPKAWLSLVRIFLPDIPTGRSTDEIYHTVEPLPTLSQATFLNSLGLEPRLRGLLAKAEEGRKKEIESAAKRLVDGLGMGKEYRVLGFVSKGTGETYPFIREDK